MDSQYKIQAVYLDDDCLYLPMVSKEENPIKISKRWETLIKNYDSRKIGSIVVVDECYNEYMQRVKIFRIQFYEE